MKLSRELVSMKNIKVLLDGEFQMSIRRNVHFNEMKCILLKDTYARTVCTNVQTDFSRRQVKKMNEYIYL